MTENTELPFEIWLKILGSMEGFERAAKELAEFKVSLSYNGFRGTDIKRAIVHFHRICRQASHAVTYELKTRMEKLRQTQDLWPSPPEENVTCIKVNGRTVYVPVEYH